MIIKKYLRASLLLAMAGVLGMLVWAPPIAHASFTSNLIMDDGIFSRTSSMSIGSINNFLNTFPSSCISTNNGFSSPDPTGYSPSTGYTYGGNVSGGQVIWDAAQAYGINPQVLIATLQKESSVVTGDASYHCTYINTAMGYGCPDSGSCPTNPATMSGFSKQVIHAAWLLRFGQQRSLGNTGWNVQLNNFPQGGDHWDNSDDPPTCYGGPMTQGNLSRGCGQAATFYDGYTTIDGQSVHMDSGATAALYWYTPHFSGNQHFVSIFESWFGPTKGGYCIGTPSPAVTDVSFRKFRRNLDSGTFIIYTGTSTNCIEDHSWAPGSGFIGWQNHLVSNQPVTSPSVGVVKFADLTGNGIDNPVYLGLNGTSTGRAEFHVWVPDMSQWIVHTASNLPLTASGTDPSVQNSSIEFADLDGNGVDEPIAIQYKNTASGKVEFWIWSAGLQGWKQHIVTNLAAPLDPSNMQIGFDDIYGNGRDQAVAFGIAGTSTGRVEFHIWGTGEQNWVQHIVSNLPTSQLSGCSIKFADLSTSGFDNGIAVCSQGTASGHIEFHVWNPDLSSWQGHYASNQSIL